MRVLISVDMEGVAGVVAPDDITPGQAAYERNRGYMTDEAGAAVRGVLAYDSGASVIVVDGHAGFRNLIPDRLPRQCTLLSGAPRRHGMMAGIGGDVDAVCFVGYHARAGTPAAVLAHTVSGGTIAQVRANGEELGELGLNVALAAHFGAMPVLATGDDSLAREAAAVAPGITTVTVKWSYGTRAAESLHPSEACERIEAAATAALQDRGPAGPPRHDGPVDLEVDVLRPHMTERALLIPGVELRGPLTLGFAADSLPDAYDLIDLFAVLAGA